MSDDGTLWGTGTFKDDGEIGFSAANPGRQHSMVAIAGTVVGQGLHVITLSSLTFTPCA